MSGARPIKMSYTGDQAALAVINARVFDGEKFTRENCVTIENGKISSLLALKPGKKPDGNLRIIDARGKTVCPGFIDMHTHGAAGIDAMEAVCAGDLQKISAAYARSGVTSALLAYFYIKGKSTLDEAIGSCGGEFAGARIIGTYLEGPFISPVKRGMIGKKYIMRPGRNAEKKLLEVLSGRKTLKVMTVAPEVDNAARIISSLKKLSIMPAIGHTDAGFEETAKAIAAGASHATHILNAMRGFHHRAPGPAAAIAGACATAEIICDGAHLHPETVKLLFKFMGAKRLVLITDSTAMQGYPAGKYENSAAGKFIIKNGAAYRDKNMLIGSCTPLNAMMRNIKNWGAASTGEILMMATSTPARVLGLKDLGRLKRGMRADIAVIDDDFNIFSTIAGGTVVFGAGN
jgi:N-acetylglucosamine-6-phosphate deacetylase